MLEADAVDYIHGGTDPTEVARLVAQARFVATFSFPFFSAPPGARVLDLGTGVGAMAAELVRAFPGIVLTGLDLAPAQLAQAAIRAPVSTYVQADAAALPFADATFDRVHVSWLLEHVPDPDRVLAEIYRVLKPGGMAHLLEVDNATLRVEPPLPELERTFACLNAAQQQRGGDPFIGQSLAERTRRLPFTQVVARSIPLRGSADDPARYRDMVEEFAGICESLDEVLDGEAVRCARAAAVALRARPETNPSSSMYYAPVLVTAWR
jgi:ubiquinone/menaquinone biosynthesis C-methylase UbiE